jgi:cation:H+ antiporter
VLRFVIVGLAGLALVTVAADQLVVGSGRLAARWGVSPVVIGVIVIGLGTSAPEFVVSGLRPPAATAVWRWATWPARTS